MFYLKQSLRFFIAAHILPKKECYWSRATCLCWDFCCGLNYFLKSFLLSCATFIKSWINVWRWFTSWSLLLHQNNEIKLLPSNCCSVGIRLLFYCHHYKSVYQKISHTSKIIKLMYCYTCITIRHLNAKYLYNYKLWGNSNLKLFFKKSKRTVISISFNVSGSALPSSLSN